MKKSLVILCSFILCFQLNADSNIPSQQQNKPTFGYTMADAFIPGAGLNDQDLQILISKTKNDISWNEANKYLYDPAYFYAGQPIKEDVENKYSKIVVPKIPNYQKALEALMRSVTLSGNPVSAYEGVTILKSYIGYEKPEQKDMYIKMVTALYKAKHCDGYLSFADIQNSSDVKLKIYEEGLMKCNKIKPYSFLIGSQIARTKINSKK